jgi:oligopeptide transport system substrate-binding protein
MRGRTRLAHVARGMGAAVVLAAGLLMQPASAWAQSTVRVNIAADPAMIDPVTYSELVAHDVMGPLYEGFTSTAADGTAVPALALSWTGSADGKVLTFRLRPEVHFHSGRIFGAKDVKYTFEALLCPGSKGGLNAPLLANVTGAKDFAAGKATEIAGVKVIDPLTVEVDFDKPDVLFPIYPFQFMDAGIVAEQGPDWMTKVSAGTGPFKFVTWKRGVEVDEAANPAYWGGAPKIDGIRFVIVPSGDTAVSMYDAGELDFVVVPENAYHRVLDDPRYSAGLIKVPKAQINYLGMNQALYAPFRDARVREAISLVINRDAMIRGLYNGAAVPLNGQVTPGVAGYSNDLPPLAYDPDRARKLLADAGFPDGKGLPPLQITSTAPNKDLITYLSSQFNKVLGMQVAVNVVERATHIKAMNAGEVAFFPWGWTADYPDAATFLQEVWYSASPYNRSRWKNPEYDRLIEQAMTQTVPEQRYALYHQAEHLLMADWATAPLPITTYVALRHANVHGLTMTPFGFSSFQPVTLH